MVRPLKIAWVTTTPWSFLSMRKHEPLEAAGSFSTVPPARYKPATLMTCLPALTSSFSALRGSLESFTTLLATDSFTFSASGGSVNFGYVGGVKAPEHSNTTIDHDLTSGIAALTQSPSRVQEISKASSGCSGAMTAARTTLSLAGICARTVTCAAGAPTCTPSTSTVVSLGGTITWTMVFFVFSSATRSFTACQRGTDDLISASASGRFRRLVSQTKADQRVR